VRDAPTAHIDQVLGGHAPDLVVGAHKFSRLRSGRRSISTIGVFALLLCSCRKPESL
jgi:hypothetical protein